MKQIKRLFAAHAQSEELSPTATIYDPLAFPPTLQSQYDIVYAAILQTKSTIKELASIIASYSLTVGYKTDFRLRHFT